MIPETSNRACYREVSRVVCGHSRDLLAAEMAERTQEQTCIARRYELMSVPCTVRDALTYPCGYKCIWLWLVLRR